MIGFELSDRLINCPLYWQNFIKVAQEFHWEDVAVRRINAMLKPHGGRYRFPGTTENPFIEFESDAQLTMFILKWS